MLSEHSNYKDWHWKAGLENSAQNFSDQPHIQSPTVRDFYFKICDIFLNIFYNWVPGRGKNL